MNTFIDLETHLREQPLRVGVLLGHIDVARGREDLHRDQMPELLISLAEATRVESIRASTAIEGYEVDPGRAARIVARPEARVRNRNEREFAGYRDAMDELMRADEPERLSVPFVLHLHRRLFSHSGGGGGQFKTDDNVIATRDPSGRRVEIFAPPPAADAPHMTTELVARYNEACDAERAHPLLLLGSFILDFLAIHPVADGNGRLARLLTTHELLRLGYGVARYVSVEQRIYESKNSYYEALRQSQVNWRQATHDTWPWLQYLLLIMSESYEAFEARMASALSTAGLTKQQVVERHVRALSIGHTFRMRDLRSSLPGISDQTFRLALATLRGDGCVEVSGSGRGATWTRTSSD